MEGRPAGTKIGRTGEDSERLLKFCVIYEGIWKASPGIIESREIEKGVRMLS